MATETTYTRLRQKLSSVLDQVIDQQEIVIVRRKGARDVALIPAGELVGLIETAHLLQSLKTRGVCWLVRPPVDRVAVFHSEFREDLRYWVKTDRSVAIRVLDLVEAVMRDPFQGPGKPEPLHIGSPAVGRDVSPWNIASFIA